ncbi:MAG TPA: DUF1592 domain-containing protein, partial [Pirellulaceae bacterium]
VWMSAAKNLEVLRMPPEDSEQPSDTERAAALEAIRDGLATVDCGGPVDPGRVTIRRLSRFEYRNTIRDLVGFHYQPAEDFPGDDVGHGFDNQGDVLTLSPLLLEKYLAAAEEIAERAVGSVEGGAYLHWVGSAWKGDESFSAARDEDHWIFAPGAIEAEVTLAVHGLYRLEVRAVPEQAGPNWPELGLQVGERLVRKQPLKEPTGTVERLTWDVTLPRGRSKLGIAFLNDYYRPEFADPGQRDRNVTVRSVTLRGPYDIQDRTPLEVQRLMANQSLAEPLSSEALRAVVRSILLHTTRRPPQRTEIDRVWAWLNPGEFTQRSSARDVKRVLTLALSSPRFLFRMEPDPADATATGIRDLDDFELATRLSYFLWSSMPGEGLFAQARRRELHTPSQLRAAARRMLKSSKAVALITNFADQWLQLRRLDSVTKDAQQFPDFDDDLVEAMRTETQLFVASLIQEDR